MVSLSQNLTHRHFVFHNRDSTRVLWQLYEARQLDTSYLFNLTSPLLMRQALN